MLYSQQVEYINLKNPDVELGFAIEISMANGCCKWTVADSPCQKTSKQNLG